MPENVNHEGGINTQTSAPERQTFSLELPEISKPSTVEDKDIHSEINQIRNQFDIPLVIKNEYYLAKEKQNLIISGGGFIDSNKTRYEIYGPNYHDSLADKIASQSCILKLRLSGVKKPADFYQAFHQRGFNDKVISRKDVIENFRNLSPAEISTGIDRVNKLGFDISYASELTNSDVSKTIKKISSIDDDKFDSVTSQLNKYCFLKDFKQDKSLYSSTYKTDSEDGLNPAFKLIFKNTEAGQIDPLVENRLNLVNEIFLLDEFSSHKDSFHHYVDVQKNGYGQKPEVADFFDNEKKFVYTFPGYIDERILDSDFKLVFQNFFSFDDNSRLRMLKSLSPNNLERLYDEKGKINFLNQFINTASDYEIKQVISYVDKYGDSVTNDFNNDDQKSDFLLELISLPADNSIQELAKSEFIEIITQNLYPNLIDSFPNEKDRNFWSLIKDLKDYRYIKPLIESGEGYLDKDNHPTEKFFEKLASLGEYRVISNYKYVYNFPHASQEFWINFSGLSNEVLNEIIEIRNSLKKPQYDSETKSNFYHQISGRLAEVSDKVLNKNNNLRGIYTFVDDSVIENFSAEDKRFWKFIRDNEFVRNKNIQKILVQNIDKFNKFFDQDNQPTVHFFETCFNSKIYPEVPRFILKYLSDKDRSFLSAFAATKNNRLIRSLIENRQSYELGKTDFFYHDLMESHQNRQGITFGEIFKIIYSDEDERLSSVIGLCGWRVFSDYLKNNNIDSQKLTLSDFRQIVDISKQEIDKKLNYIKNTELDIPKGMRVSIGTEIEVMLNGIARTGQITKDEINDYVRLNEKLKKRPVPYAEEYNAEIKEKISKARNLYSNQVSHVDEMGVGKGKDALHEFSNNATKNYSVLVWELYEISRLGFLDFDRKLLQNIERGMHLTISGDQDGVRLDKNAHLLQNAMLASGWSTDALDAAGASQTVDVVSDNSDKLYRQRKGYILQRNPSQMNSLRDQVFEEISSDIVGVENRALRITSFDNLARTIENFYHLSVPLKAYQNFIRDYGAIAENKLLSVVNSKLDQKYSLSKLIEESSSLIPEVEDKKAQKAIISWVYFRESTVRNFEDKQNNLSKYRLKNPLLEYNNRDMTRLGSELLEVFGGITDEGEKTDDALKKYNEKAEAGSLPSAERKLILEVKREVRKIFKPKK